MELARTTASPLPVSTSLIERMTDSMGRSQPFFSFEYFPPSSAAGTRLLQQRAKRMVRLEPMWVDVTWSSSDAAVHNTSASSSSSSSSSSSPSSSAATATSTRLGTSAEASLALCKEVQERCGAHSMLHLTCRGATVATLKAALRRARQGGIRSILAIRGDQPAASVAASNAAPTRRIAPAAGGMALLARMRAQRSGRKPSMVNIVL